MKHKSRLLEAVHETAKDLKEGGYIDKRALNRYDALCIEPVPPYSPEQIRTLRDRYRISWPLSSTPAFQQSRNGKLARSIPADHP